MAGESSRAAPSAAPALGPTFPGAGTDTKAKFVPLETKNTELGWGIVHFYRDGEETQSMDRRNQTDDGKEETQDDDYTTLCIPAVPASMSPDDFVDFLGQEWLGHVSHCRMVLTSNMNRNLVLLKFRDSQRAKEWRRAYDGTLFSPAQSQICHVVFVKSITFETPTQRKLSHNFTSLSASVGVSNSLRPFPPPTPNLVELPTCPVCLERMDDTNGLMTTPCSHIFHCTCLKNWKATTCPVCRFTLPQSETDDPDNPSAQPFGSSGANMCTVCDCTDDLWICLICGYVGCGRYKKGHAKDHWKETAHCFSLEIETQHVWDYAGDMWVHRLIRDKGDGKVVELPSSSRPNQFREEEDVVPRAKLESIALEYTHLLQSQLESQRAYFEEMINKTVDKASKASAAAEDAAMQASSVTEKMALLEDKYETLTTETIPQLERELDRERKKARKSEDLARSLGKSLQEEKRMTEGLLKRVEHLTVDDEARAKQDEERLQEIAELKEMNRDLSMFISGQEKLKELENEGKIEEGDIEGGTASVPEKKTRRRGKKK